MADIEDLRELLTGKRGKQSPTINKAEAEQLKRETEGEADSSQPMPPATAATPKTDDRPQTPAFLFEPVKPKEKVTEPGAPPVSDVHLNHVNSAVSSLEQALAAVGSHTPAGRTILDTLKTLSKQFGQKQESNTIPPEIKAMTGAQQ